MVLVIWKTEVPSVALWLVQFESRFGKLTGKLSTGRTSNREAWTVPYTATGLQGEKPLVSEIK